MSQDILTSMQSQSLIGKSNIKSLQSSSLPCMYLNARSLTNKITLLSQYAKVNEPKIIGITETWAKPEFPDGIYTISGYKLLRADRSDKRGGGVMLYIHESVSFSEASFGSFFDFEYLSCTINLPNDKRLGLLCVYRPPNISDDGDNKLIQVLETFLKQKYYFNVIIGDFNMPQIDWKNFSGPTKNASFINFCLNHYLKQHIHEPTRPSSETTLDLIFSTVDTKIRDVSINECFGSSDHSMVNYNIDLPCLWKSFVPIQTRRNYNKADWNKMQNLLSEINWDTVFSHSNINDVWENFKRNLSQVANASIPLKRINSWRIKSSAKIRSSLRFYS